MQFTITKIFLVNKFIVFFDENINALKTLKVRRQTFSVV